MRHTAATDMGRRASHAEHVSLMVGLIYDCASRTHLCTPASKCKGVSHAAPEDARVLSGNNGAVCSSRVHGYTQDLTKLSVDRVFVGKSSSIEILNRRKPSEK